MKLFHTASIHIPQKHSRQAILGGNILPTSLFYRGFHVTRGVRVPSLFKSP
jgi:hypothetical protein